MFTLAAAGLVFLALYAYRKMNPAPDTKAVNAQYTTETDKSIVTVGPAVIRTLSEKKEWDDAIAFANENIPR